jgi:hypothetical protein
MLRDLLAGRLRGNGGQPKGIVNASFVGVADGDAAFDTSAEVAALVEANTATNGYAKVWQKTVPPGQKMAWGSGSGGFPDNQGYAWFAAIDAATGFEDGVIRLTIADQDDFQLQVVREFDSRQLHTVTPTTLVTAQPLGRDNLWPLPFTGLYVPEDWRLGIWFRSTVVTTTVDQVGFSFPVTIMRGGG